MRDAEQVPELLAGLAHAGGDRAAALHRGQRVDRAKRPPDGAGAVGDLPAQLLDGAMAQPLSRRDNDNIPPATGERAA